jgi:radical SAM superfamily enzyme YgiQ (UPF0313 family)
MSQKKKLCTCGKTKNPLFCDHSHKVTTAPPVEQVPSHSEILLMMLPYWDPLVPPQGIAHLKYFLQLNHYTVKTKNSNTHKEFKGIYNCYYSVLRKYIPENKRGNFFNIGHDVLRNHMLAHINYVNEKEYIELVKEIIYQTFFTHFSDRQVKELNKIWDDFYKKLEEYIIDLVVTEKPAVVGLSVPRDSLAASLFAFKLVKERFPHIMTVMGGSIFVDQLRVGTPNFEHFTAKTPFIDKIIIGEGQLLFLKLLRGELPENQGVFTKEDIGGEMLGFSPLNIPDMSEYDIYHDYPYLAAQASSSCPNQCSFCHVAASSGKYREKDPKQTVAEMKYLFETYHLQLFFMTDALLNQVATPLSEEFLKDGVAIYWDGYLRVSEAVGDYETTMLWRRGGMYRARLGVESGSQHVLDMMDKGITIEQTRMALASLANAGIKTTAYWVIGHPGETEKDFLQTLQLLEECKNHIYEAECNPFIYSYSGQGKTEDWQDKRVLLYPEKAKDMLITQTWKLDGLPTREEIYERVNRFVAHCNHLGIPNPYSLHEIFKADMRWKELHRNAVPRVVDFKYGGDYIDECKHAKELSLLENKLHDEGDFGFSSAVGK